MATKRSTVRTKPAQGTSRRASRPDLFEPEPPREDFREQFIAHIERLDADLRERWERNDWEPMLALMLVQMAALVDTPIPPTAAAWLRQHLGRYLAGDAESLDAALGLKGYPGGEPPRSKFVRQGRENTYLSGVMQFRALGATKAQAVHMVAFREGLMASTLERKYNEAKLGNQYVQVKADVSQWTRRQVIELLATVPDADEEIRLAKQRINRKFASQASSKP